MTTFLETGLNQELLDAISDLGFINPTPIQEKTIPLLLESDEDIIAFAQTGTGKTAAFGLPSVQLTDVSKHHTQTLVLAPTRELCLQITKDMKDFAKNSAGLRVLAVYGGSSIENQIRDLKKGAQIVVATPGRAKDLLKRRKLNIDRIDRIVLDEADEMLTMGFKDDLDAILSKTPDDKQTLLFSATMSKEMARITKKYMHDPIEVQVAKMNVGTTNVDHILFETTARNRFEALKRIIDVNPNIYSIVFCRTRRETNEIAHKLGHAGYNADAINGDLSQAQRDDVMGRFRTKRLQILVATDVAARGIDVNDLTHVINYNLPDEPEIYTHRSGRTGRAGKSGISVVIVHTRETKKIKAIERFSGITFKKELIPTGEEICQAQLFTLMDKIDKIEVDEDRIAPFLPKIYEKLDDLSREDLIKHMVSAEFNRFLSYYKNAADINVKEDKRQPRSHRSSVGFTRFFINLGKKDKLNPARLIGLINEALDDSSIEIGRIDLMATFSFFEIDSAAAERLHKNINNNNMVFNGRRISVEPSEEKKKGGKRKGRKNDKYSTSTSRKSNQKFSKQKDFIESGQKRKKSKSRRKKRKN